MHNLEPHYNWHSYYLSSEDIKSPFFGREYSEFEFTHSIYNHVIHPQWDDIGSPTLFIKILFADYDEGVAIIELIGEWNDCINNDIMFLKRDIADLLIKKGINKFILIGENVFNFHHSDDCYYEEWFDDIDDGWIAFLNFREHVVKEFQQGNIDYYIVLGGILNELHWRTLTPQQLFEHVNAMVMKRLN
ncbi:MAG: hypothetical protein H0V01_12525 [Bacteroidetes bacterium]|nr:hypothetical protein [Bacteroidota bacterium]HET6245347.1 hypothetical protein [Bacteroidia bacterium]